jgi:superoxide dismutase, Fe-Mn family
MLYELPKLKFSFDALEPYLDRETMEIHYSKHHKAYLDKYLSAIESSAILQNTPINKVLSELKSQKSEFIPAIQNFGGGFYNHNLFWEEMTPQQKDINVNSTLLNAIQGTFGNKANMIEQFTNKALTLFGSGWTWLISDQNGNLSITNTANQDNPISSYNCKIILALDVWEHAYYLKYQNRRAEYIENWWNVVDWEVAETRYTN